MPETPYDHLIGKRVQHNCGNPKCDITGTVLRIVNRRAVSRRGETTEWWAVVLWTINGEKVEMPVAAHRVTVED